MQILSTSNPTNLVRVGGYVTSGSAYGVHVAGNYAYVAELAQGTSGWGGYVEVIDVSNPASPVRLGRYETSGSPYRLQVVGNDAYVADGEWGLLILELPCLNP